MCHNESIEIKQLRKDKAMSEKPKEIENTPEKAVYSFGEGKDMLTFSISKGETGYEALDNFGSFYYKTKTKKTSFVKLELSSNEVTLYSIEKKGYVDAEVHSSDAMAPDIGIKEKKQNIFKAIAEKLYDDNSKEAIAVKKFLKKIDGNTLINKLNECIEETPQRREAELQRQKEEQLERQQSIDAYRQRETEKRNNAQNAVQQFVGEDFVGEDKDIMSEQKENVASNKLSILRKKIAHDIDETLGTHLEEKKIVKPIKKIEKAVSDKLFGKVNE